MRTAWIKSLEELAAKDPRVFLVVGDLGFGVVQDFATRFPNQFLNTGINEQGMTGVAAGLAMTGKVVFTYSIGNFPTLRCLEQIRNDVCYHNADVKIVTVGGGYSYGALGASHHATEDLAIMRALPGITVLAPGDPWEVKSLMSQMLDRPGPCYLRLGRAGEPDVHKQELSLEIGRMLLVREGQDLTIVSTGGMLATANEVATQLSTHGVEARLLSCHTLKPFDREAIIAAGRETGLVVTVEEHSIIGGLGSAVAEALATSTEGRARLKICGVKDEFGRLVGDQAFQLEQQGLTPQKILAEVLALVPSAQKS